MWRESRLTHYALLITVAAVLLLPNLGGPSLWDEDEGLNAEASREMREASTWIIPTFNFELRTAKPAMVNWVQRVSYAVFGVNEWAARFPSALASLGTILLTYELARRMFGAATGLLAGVVLASAMEFSVVSHAATPDAVLLFFTVLTFTVFWFGQENGSQRWWQPTAAACGLAFLTKGPVGVVIPGLVIFLYFLWNRELARLWDRRIFKAIGVGILVAAPWYGWVAAETRGEWVKAFFLNENVNRALAPMERHAGPIYYYPLVLLVLFAPWSVFIVGSLWYGVKGTRTPTADPDAGLPERRAHRFLVAWFASYLVVFSIAATKLPNYILPLYPAVAMLTARFLTQWRMGSLPVSRVLMPLAIGGMGLVALGLGLGLLLAGGAVHLVPMRTFEGLERWAWLGLIPLTGAILMAIALRRNDRARFVRVMAICSVLLVALAVLPAGEVDRYKAPRELVAESGANDTSRDLRVGCYQWFLPSVVFYSQHQVKRVWHPDLAVQFLTIPSPAFLFMPEKEWPSLQPRVPFECRVVSRRFDFYSNQTVLVISNEPVPAVASAAVQSHP